MKAAELTKLVNAQQSKIIELEKEVKYLIQEYEKMRLIIDDLKIDVKMNMQ